MKNWIYKIKMWYWHKYKPDKYFYEYGKKAAENFDATLKKATESLRGFGEVLRETRKKSEMAESRERIHIDRIKCEMGDFTAMDSGEGKEENEKI